MQLLNFIKINKRLLLVGLLMTFFSGFGQTYLIALYVPAISNTFDLSNSAFGSLYAAATICSAAALIYVGKWIDRVPLRYFSLGVFIFFALALLLTAYAFHPIMLFIGLWGMRLGGQGLMSHTSITTMARFFDHARGKAISVATLGYPIAEAIFPIVIALAIGSIGWQLSLVGSAIILLVVMIPVVILSLPKAVNAGEGAEKIEGNQAEWTQKEVLKSKQFSIIGPNVFLMPMLTTGFFFYQLSLAEFKGWTAEWIALCFVGFAIASSSSMLISGFLIDRFKAKNLFSFYYIPFLAGLIFLWIFDTKWTALVYMLLMGITVGFGGIIKSALQAELFGVKSLGAVRSLFSTLMVLSTAIGPVLFGFLLDYGFNFNQIIAGAIVAMLLVVIQSFRIYTGFTKRRIYVRLKTISHLRYADYQNKLYGFHFFNMRN
jgi:MFS family permease